MHDPKDQKHQHHHILSDRLAIRIGVALLVLTGVTVWSASYDLGALNMPIAMLIACTKAALVILFFMNLKYERRENAVIFLTSFLFLVIFVGLTSTDIFFRGNVYVKKGELIAGAQAKSRLSKPWVSTPELVAQGKEKFAVNCATCHGAAGQGNGPAAAALNPPPRNFTATAGWKNGRKPSQIFKTLKEGIAGSSMGSFASLPVDDRWALTHYVASLGPSVEKDSNEDLAKIGIDPTKESAGEEKQAATISVDFAMERMTEAPVEVKALKRSIPHPSGVGAEIYQNQCASCHGQQAEGGQKVAVLGGTPKSFAMTMPLTAEKEGMRSQDSFNQIVIKGIQGNLMPGNGQLSGTELRDLYQYIRNLSAVR